MEQVCVILDKESRKYYDGENNDDNGKTLSHNISEVHVWSSIPT